MLNSSISGGDTERSEAEKRTALAALSLISGTFDRRPNSKL